MSSHHSTLSRRISVTLPAGTARIFARLPRGERGRAVDQALRLREMLRRYVESAGFGDLDARLEEGAIRNAARDRQTSIEWAHVDQEAWEELDQP